MRSIVLAPIDPVGPSMVTLRGAASATGAVRMRGADSFIGSPHQESAAWRDKTAAGNAQQARERRRGNETIEPVHQPAMARNELARVLGAEPALERGFQQISRLRR